MTCKITSLATLACILVLLDGANARIAQADERTAMELEAKIALGDVRGRIDHMAVDLARQRVFVAELGNDSVGIIDLKARKLIRTLSGPQGAARRRLPSCGRYSLRSECRRWLRPQI